ncbi:hypothetical protein CPB86DRAFT_520875 [Serendipita vermifera]|nr:hypothetical protein CPB86DRAFT_520875 [Serendipita vermifera]
MSIITRLPYEILCAIFDLLDARTLCHAALTSRSINETASWCLYRYILVNPEGEITKHTEDPWETEYLYRCDTRTARLPFSAFQRRPHLRNSVETLFIRGVDYEVSSSHFAAFIDEIRLLKNVKRIEMHGNYDLQKLDLLMPILYEMPSLSLLVADTTFVLQYLNEHSPRDIGIQTMFDELIESHCTGLGPIVTSLFILYWDQDLIDTYLKSFRSLHTLTVAWIGLAPSVICAAIAPLKNLVVLSFDFAGLRVDDSPPISPTGLTNLKDLRLGFQKGASLTFVHLVEHLIKCIAGESSLERLDIKPSSKKTTFVGVHGSFLISHVLSTHSKTIKKLKIPTICPSPLDLQQIITKCTSLQTLWIKANRELMVHMSTFLPLSTSLSRLRVYARYDMRLCDAEGLMYQNDCGLQTLKVYPIISGKSLPATKWTVSWSYNDKEGCAMRKVKKVGPDSLTDHTTTMNTAPARRPRRRLHRRLMRRTGQ